MKKESANFHTDKLLGVLFPKKCVSCGTYLEKDETDFCTSCKKDIERVAPPYCPYCHKGKRYCKCNRRERAYDFAAAPFYYSGSVKNAVRRLKFASDEYVSVVLGKEMSATVNSLFFGAKFDIITCVPCTGKSLSERGYNQSQSLAEQIDLNPSMWALEAPPVRDWHLLRKEKTTGVQHLLSAENRRRNIELAYKLNSGRDVREKTILLIDDILTTGATVEACAAELLLHGAKHVYVAVAAMVK